MDLIKDEDEAKAEQAILQDHKLKIIDLVDRLGKLVVVPHKTKPVTELDLLRKSIDLLRKSYRQIKESFDHHGLDMDRT